jgi:hypothetical protein
MDAVYLNEKLDRGFLDSNHLLGSLKFLDVSSKDTPAFGDPRYFPFYYYLGTQTTPKSVVQIGAKLGLIGACFMQGCKTVEDWLAMDSYDIKPPASIITSNLKRFGQTEGKYGFMLLNDSMLEMNNNPDYRIDMGLLTEKYNAEKTSRYLEFLWRYLNPEGLLVVDYIQEADVKDSFKAFCRVKNREPEVFETRYGVGVITR